MAIKKNAVSISGIMDFMEQHQAPEEKYLEKFYTAVCDFSMALVEHRMKLQLSQAQLADVIGCKQAMVSKLESGDYNISLKNLFKICTTLGIGCNVSFNEQSNVNPISYDNEAEFVDETNPLAA